MVLGRLQAVSVQSLGVASKDVMSLLLSMPLCAEEFGQMRLVIPYVPTESSFTLLLCVPNKSCFLALRGVNCEEVDQIIPFRDL